MEFNPSKCQVLHITRSRKPVRYFMPNQELESVDMAKYLGVNIRGINHCNSGKIGFPFIVADLQDSQTLQSDLDSFQRWE